VGHEINIFLKAYKSKLVLSECALLVFEFFVVLIVKKIKYKDFLCFQENIYKFEKSLQDPSSKSMLWHKKAACYPKTVPSSSRDPANCSENRP